MPDGKVSGVEEYGWPVQVGMVGDCSLWTNQTPQVAMSLEIIRGAMEL